MYIAEEQAPRGRLERLACIYPAVPASRVELRLPLGGWQWFVWHIERQPWNHLGGVAMKSASRDQRPRRASTQSRQRNRIGCIPSAPS
jgi:hypothetical protein